MELIGWVVALVCFIALTVYMFVSQNEQKKRDEKSFVKWLVKVIMLILAVVLTAYITYKSF